MLFLFVGCTKEEDVDGDYKYEKTDTISVLSHKEDYFYPGTSIKSKNKYGRFKFNLLFTN